MPAQQLTTGDDRANSRIDGLSHESEQGCGVELQVPVPQLARNCSGEPVPQGHSDAIPGRRSTGIDPRARRPAVHSVAVRRGASEPSNSSVRHRLTTAIDTERQR